MVQMVKNPSAMQETWVRSLGQEDPLEKGMAVHFSLLVWRIPRTEEPGGRQFMGSQRVGQYVNCELADVQVGFRKGGGTGDQIANIHWVVKKARVPEKHLLLLYWLCQSLWLCGSQQTIKFFKRWEYQTTWPASWQICMQVKKQQLELDMKQQTGSKSGKE